MERKSPFVCAVYPESPPISSVTVPASESVSIENVLNSRRRQNILTAKMSLVLTPFVGTHDPHFAKNEIVGSISNQEKNNLRAKKS
jgi:hypothetical protein